MMTTPRLRPLGQLSALLAFALLLIPAHAQDAAASDPQAVRIQITEISLLRTLVMVDRSAADLEPQLINALIARDLRVTQGHELTEGRITASDLMAAGERANADLIVHATVEDRRKDSYGGTEVYEARAVVQAVNRATGETQAMGATKWIAGVRSSKPDKAKETAREAAAKQGIDAAVESVLARAHKMMVYEAVIVNVFSDSALLAQMEYIGKMEGIYHVRRLAFDRQTNEAKIEIIGTPRSQTYWRAYLEKMPKTRVNVQVTPNDALRNKYPSWFLPPAN